MNFWKEDHLKEMFFLINYYAIFREKNYTEIHYNWHKIPTNLIAIILYEDKLLKIRTKF